jgi:hypothetical protein
MEFIVVLVLIGVGLGIEKTTSESKTDAANSGPTWTPVALYFLEHDPNLGAFRFLTHVTLRGALAWFTRTGEGRARYTKVASASLAVREEIITCIS